MSFIIRKLDKADNLRCFSLFKDPDVIQFVHLPTPSSVSDCKARINKILQSKTKTAFVAQTEDTGIIGMVIITTRTNRLKKHTATLTIMVQSSYQRIGVGTALLQKAIEFGEDKGLHLIELKCRTDNIKAINLYKKFGFETEGILKDRILLKGQLLDLCVMSKIL